MGLTARRGEHVTSNPAAASSDIAFRTPADYTDPATSLPRYEPLLQALREQLEDSRKGLKAIYSPQTHMYVAAPRSDAIF